MVLGRRDYFHRFDSLVIISLQYPLVHVELQSIVLALAIRDLVDGVGHILAVAVVLGGQLLATFPVHQNQVPIVPIDENRID